MSAHSVGNGHGAHGWIDALSEGAERITMPDSCRFTPSGRRLLVSLGIVEPDPLRVEAEAWLLEHRGPMTEAVLAVRKALGPRPPADWLAASKAFRNVK